MSEKKQKTLLGVQTKKFRVRTALSMDGLALLTHLSKATISRIESGSDFRMSVAKKIAAVLGLTVRQFEDMDFDAESEAALNAAIKRNMSDNNISDPHLLLDKSKKSMRGPTYYIQILVERGYFDDRRSMKEIVSFILDEYGVSIKGPKLTNALRARKDIGRAHIENSNHYYYYREKPSEQNKDSAATKAS